MLPATLERCAWYKRSGSNAGVVSRSSPPAATAARPLALHSHCIHTLAHGVCPLRAHLLQAGRAPADGNRAPAPGLPAMPPMGRGGATGAPARRPSPLAMLFQICGAVSAQRRAAQSITSRSLESPGGRDWMKESLEHPALYVFQLFLSLRETPPFLGSPFYACTCSCRPPQAWGRGCCSPRRCSWAPRCRRRVSCKLALLSLPLRSARRRARDAAPRALPRRGGARRSSRPTLGAALAAPTRCRCRTCSRRGLRH